MKPSLLRVTQDFDEPCELRAGDQIFVYATCEFSPVRSCLTGLSLSSHSAYSTLSQNVLTTSERSQSFKVH